MSEYEQKLKQAADRYRTDAEYRETLRRKSRRQGWKEMGFDPNTAEAEYERLYDLQHGLCAICDKPESVSPHGGAQRLALDHCPDTMRIRGLLCIRCNRGIGNFDDDAEVMKRAAEYLNR